MNNENKILLETNRLIIRKYIESDFQDLYEYLSDEEVVKYEPYKPLSKEETKENLKWRINSDEMLAIVLKENKKMIGNVYLGKRDYNQLELGYVLNKNYWHQGYAKEAIESLLKNEFSKGIHRIYAECDTNNIASQKLLESLNFQKEALLKENIYFWKDENEKPIWKDTLIYALLNKNSL